MLREEYIKELRSRLRGLNESEIEDAITYCEEYFNEAESEEKAIEDLGTPAKFAAQLKADAACKTSKDPNAYQRPRSMLKTCLVIMAGIFALPIALPFLLLVAILIFVFGIVLFVFVLCGFVMIAAMFYAAIMTFVAAFTYGQGAGDVLMHFGVSLICLGLGILAVIMVHLFMKVIIPSFIRSISNFYERHKGGRRNEIE